MSSSSSPYNTSFTAGLLFALLSTFYGELITAGAFYGVGFGEGVGLTD
jgi:hypothetical protein